ncbi:DUF805 domain-containing protein [Rhodopseudomonas sp. B29]|uniref:DUF805 domain-containing protein n=1 Tax=Rhodopseudomonas sp. B29 TaxID=95607 RepID=UPI0003B3B779|nr:DUF805 domain-containing protein [Rhodopseudomonas sp. B29]
MNLTTLLFSFQGRINRARYWLVELINLAIFVVCFALILIGAGVSSAIYATGTALSYLSMVIFAIATLLLIWSSTVAGIKRLHDRDQSGWWMLVFWGVSTIVGLLEETDATSSGKFILGVGSLAVTVWITIELGCLRGTRGPNQYGPDPLAPKNTMT